jgi:hypothetical protein
MMASDSIHYASFALDGEMIGRGSTELAKLSPKWLETCGQILNANGPSFRSSLGGSLNHLEFQLTSGGGACLGMFFAHGALAISSIYLSGASAAAERDVQAMFLESLAKAPIVWAAAPTAAKPFEALDNVVDRPFFSLVFWAPHHISDSDNAALGDLATHFAGALFRNKLPPNNSFKPNPLRGSA